MTEDEKFAELLLCSDRIKDSTVTIPLSQYINFLQYEKKKKELENKNDELSQKLVSIRDQVLKLCGEEYTIKNKSLIHIHQFPEFLKNIWKQSRQTEARFSEKVSVYDSATLLGQYQYDGEKWKQMDIED